MLIEQLTEHFDAKNYKDTYTEELQKVIAQKAKGRPVRAKDEPVPVTDMHDLMEILRESLDMERPEPAHVSRRSRPAEEESEEDEAPTPRARRSSSRTTRASARSRAHPRKETTKRARSKTR